MDDLHDFYFVINLPKRKKFQSTIYQTIESCIKNCEKKLRELHINHSDGVVLGYTTKYGSKFERRPEHGEINP